MPEWLTALFAALLGGALSLAGVWMQLRYQDRRAVASARGARAEVFAKVLAVLSQYSPQRAREMLERQEPMPRGWDAEQILAPLRDQLASCAAADPRLADEVMRIVTDLFSYFDTLPGIDHWEGESAVVASKGSAETRAALHARLEQACTALLARAA